jgi:hypothetical protein
MLLTLDWSFNFMVMVVIYFDKPWNRLTGTEVSPRSHRNFLKEEIKKIVTSPCDYNFFLNGELTKLD